MCVCIHVCISVSLINCCQAVASQCHFHVSFAYSPQAYAVLSWSMVYLTTWQALVSISSSGLRLLVFWLGLLSGYVSHSWPL